MIKIISLITTLTISLGLLACATTGKQDADRPGIEMSSTAKISATVQPGSPGSQ